MAWPLSPLAAPLSDAKLWWHEFILRIEEEARTQTQRESQIFFLFTDVVLSFTGHSKGFSPAKPIIRPSFVCICPLMRRRYSNSTCNKCKHYICFQFDKKGSPIFGTPKYRGIRQNHFIVYICWFFLPSINVQKSSQAISKMNSTNRKLPYGP